MKRIRYTKYTGDPASEMSMEDLLKALSEYLLDSGFQDPWSRFAELDGEHTMDNLREALRQALEAGDLFDSEMQQRIEEMAENGQLDQLIDRIIQRMEQENYISSQGRQEPGLFGLQDLARSAGFSGQIQLWTPRYQAFCHRH